MGHRLSRWLAHACALTGFYRWAPNFPAKLQRLPKDQPADVAVGTTTVWEIAIKTARSKLPDIRTRGHATLTAMLQAYGSNLLPLDPTTTDRAANLRPLHAEPFDRALVALERRSGRTVRPTKTSRGRGPSQTCSRSNSILGSGAGVPRSPSQKSMLASASPPMSSRASWRPAAATMSASKMSGERRAVRREAA